MTLGEKIQGLRKQQGLSQEALAERVSVTRQTISKWELDQSTPDLEFLAQLSDIFDVSSDYLIKSELTRPDELPFKKRSYRPSQKVRGVIFAVISAGALAAAVICLICDYFSSPGLSWSWLAIASIGAAWLLLLPALVAREKNHLDDPGGGQRRPLPSAGRPGTASGAAFDFQVGKLYRPGLHRCRVAHIWDFSSLPGTSVAGLWFCFAGDDPAALGHYAAHCPVYPPGPALL